MSRLVISTDMDGTLLDHDSYDFASALPFLQQLSAVGIPDILNTSKTVIYDVTGGFRAVMHSDVLQMIILVNALVLLFG